MRCYKVFNCLMCIIATSCEAATRPGPNHLVSDEAAVPYSGLMQRLFDDEFGGIALGTPWNHSNAEERLFLSRRALSAGAVLLCSVGTVTEGSIDDSTATSVEFRGPGYFPEWSCLSAMSKNINCFQQLQLFNSATIGCFTGGAISGHVSAPF